MLRYLIIGCSGSSKPTLAERLASLCHIPYINTDNLYLNSDWSIVPEDEVLAAIDLEAESYVLDGNPNAFSQRMCWCVARFQIS